MKLTQIIFLLMAITQWESAYAIIGYDCRSKILNMTTISLVDIDDCELGEEKAEMFLPEIALLQLNEYEHTKIIQCKVEVNRVIQHCGWQSYNSIVNQGINEYIFPISREMCQVAHDHGTFRIGNTVFDGLMPNVTSVRSITLAGSVNNNGDCTNAQYSDPFGTWDSVFVVGTVKITIRSGTTRVKVAEDKVYLPSGTKCKLSKGHCIDPENGHTFWNTLPRKYCIPETYSILYRGYATKLISTKETVYSLSVRDTSFSLSTTGVETSCGLPIIRTEHPKLYIVESKNLGLLEKNNIVETDVDNLDIFVYVNAKFIYVERYLRSQTQSLYVDVIRKRCKLEKEMLKNTLSIASTQPDEFAYRYMEGPGYMAVVAGEVVHIVQCVPVEVKIQHKETCYNRIPVQRGNQSLYLTPRTHVITNYATELPCNSPLLQYYKLGQTWYKFMPKPIETLPPKVLKPSTRMSWKYQNPANLDTGGIYLEKDLDAMRGRIMFTMEQTVVMETMAQQFTNHSKGYPSLINALNEEVLEHLAESAWSKTWGKFTGFGTYCAGIIGIVMCFRAVKLVADTVVHGYALHTVYGWSLCLLGAVWDSMTHLLLHLGRRQQTKKGPSPSAPNTDPEKGETPDSKTQEVYPLLPRINTSTGPPTEIATTQRVFV
ncbi:GSCOCG00012645001-RA-CDS [Cotesia congregata]|nr:GSCOCG00012645001-RA-CDS [Cotesia congregata]